MTAVQSALCFSVLVVVAGLSLPVSGNGLGVTGACCGGPAQKVPGELSPPWKMLW